MSEPHLGGDLVIQVTGEEHSHEALAKRVILELLDLAATGFYSPSVLKGSSANAMLVALGDPTTGSPISLKNPGRLADGTLTTTLITLYTVSSAKKTWITKIRARNTGASTRTVTFTFKNSSSEDSRYIWPATPLLPGESTDLIAGEGVMGLSTGNIIEGQQDAGSDVDFFISGEELQ